ncbi:MAG TPA: hypothetical protein VNI77_10365 [Nitrososphaera sp.]|nr:hypothetical protein [Nitrososphaera sp.]
MLKLLTIDCQKIEGFFFEDAKSDKANALQVAYFRRVMAVRFKKIFLELHRRSWLTEKTIIYPLGEGVYFTAHPLHLFRHTMAQYYLAATTGRLFMSQA